MRVLQVIPCYLPAQRYGGPVQSVHDLCIALTQMGVDVTVYTTNADGAGTLDNPAKCENEIDGVKIHYYPIQFPRSFFRSSELRRAITSKVSEFDIVHIHWLYVFPTLVAARECIAQRIPYILSPRGMLDRYAVTLKGRIKKWLYIQMFEKRHIRCASAVHFTTNGELANAEFSETAVKRVVIPNGINLGKIPSALDGVQFLKRFPELEQKKIVLFLGRINHIKGLDLLIHAWSIVIDAVPDAHLVLAGPDDSGFGRNVVRWLGEWRVANHATFTGLLLNSEKYSAIAAANLLVCPSYLESFGMAVVEALACRKPVVVTNRVYLSDVIENEDAGLITSLNPAELAKSVIFVLRNPDLGLKMGMRGRQLVERLFELKLVGQQMYELYTALVENT